MTFSEERNLSDKIHSVRAINQGGIEAEIIGITVKEEFSALYPKDFRNNVYEFSNNSDCRGRIHDYFRDNTWSDNPENYAVKRDSRLDIEVRNPSNGGTRHFSVRPGVRWDEDGFAEAVYDHIENLSDQHEDFTDVSETWPLTVHYDPGSDDDITIRTSYGEIGHNAEWKEGRSEQRVRFREDEETLDEVAYREWEWLEYLESVKDEDGWISRPIKELEPHGSDRVELRADVPTTEASFSLDIDESQRSAFWDLVEAYGTEPEDIEGEEVYLKPFARNADYERLMNEGDEYTVAIDDEREWELAIQNPNRTLREKLSTLFW